MDHFLTYYGTRDYTMPAIDQRIADLLQRRIGAQEGLPTESTKERLAKYKEYRNDRLGSLKTTHRHVLEVVAYILNTEPPILEEGIIDKDEYVQTLDSFIIQGGRHAIIIYYQPMEPPPFESGRWVSHTPKEEYIRCCITDGSTEQFVGKCVIVYRLRSDVEFGTKQLLEETYYAYAEVDPESKSALAGIWGLISRLNEPAITFNIQWGELSRSEVGQKIKNNFIGDFRDFSEFLSMTKIDLEGVVNFDVDWELYTKYLLKPESIMKNASNPDVLIAVEENVTLWMKIMDRAIVGSQQLRREPETVGPTAELTYWRRLLTRFSSIVEHIKSPHTQMLIQLLIQAKSKLVKKWKKLDNQVTTLKILSQDNVKYLYALERFTQPLYRLDPTKIGDYLPSIMYAIRMIYATSRFFNTRRMVTAVFVKMTNQLILSCKAYLTENGTVSVWHDAKLAVLSRMKNCITLCEQYYDCYNEMRKRVNENPDEKPFEVSEMYVFGKFNTFKTRINKLIDILQTTLNYSILHCSTIEGIDIFAQKFTSFFQKIASKKYDPLDHRKPYFDPDYEEFKKNVAETELELRHFFFKIVSVVPTIDSALQLVARYL